MSGNAKTNQGAIAGRRYQQQRISHWDSVAKKQDNWSSAGVFYHKQLAHHYKLLVPPGLRVIEIGCGRGDLLAELKPSVGVPIERPLMSLMFRLLGYNIRNLHFSTEKDVSEVASSLLLKTKLVRMYSPLPFLGAVYEVGHFVKEKSTVTNNSRGKELPL